MKRQSLAMAADHGPRFEMRRKGPHPRRRTLDRLGHGAYRIVIEGESFGKPKPMLESRENALANHAKSRFLETLRSRVLGAILSGLVMPMIPGRIKPIRGTFWGEYEQGLQVYLERPSWSGGRRFGTCAQR